MDTIQIIWFGVLGAGIVASFGYTYSCQRYNAATASEAARGVASKADAIADNLAEYKVNVAKDFATINHLRDVERNTLLRLDHMDGKLDQLIGRLIPER